MLIPRTLAILLLLLCGTVRAQLLPAAGGMAYGPRGQSHAWVALPLTNPTIVHLAPRAAAADASPDAVKPAEPGSTRLAAPLAEMPLAMAARENHIYLLFNAPAAAATPAGAPMRLPVLALGAYPGPMGTVWTFDNIGGRLRVLPDLPLEGQLVSFAGTHRGPAALIRSGGGLRLLVLDTLAARDPVNAWRELPLPEGFAAAPEGVSLVSIARGVGLVRLAPGNQGTQEPLANGFWAGTFLTGEEPAEGEIRANWAFRPLSMALGGDGGIAPAPEGPVYRVHGSSSGGAIGSGVLVYTTREVTPGSMPVVRVWAPDSRQTRLLSTLPDVGERYAVAPLDDVGRLAVLWTVPLPPAASPTAPAGEGAEESAARPGRGDAKAARPPAEVMVAEVSVADGTVIYRGPAIGKGPVSSEELRLLVVAMVAVMALILVFVLKPEEGRAPVHLPRGVALAEPGRRVMAAVIDLILAALVTSSLTGRSALELILLTGVFTDSEGMLGLLMMLMSGFVLSTLGEWLFARSVGKALTGCAVAVPKMVDMPDAQVPGTSERVPTLGRPTIWRAAVRNLVKWFLPPVAMMGLSAPDFRHRGDISAGTIVVAPTGDAD